MRPFPRPRRVMTSVGSWRGRRDRFALRDRLNGLDAEADAAEIARALVQLEFPWDINQALNIALFRTFAVPSIGGLLHRTGEFEKRTQKRYDDTVLILEAVSEHGLNSPEGRMAVRRMNQMHAAYDISNDDLRYVLSTFVVMPVRWCRDFAWRGFTPHEVRAWTTSYRDLGRQMAIRDLPSSFDEFAALMDAYETEHYAYDAGARAVADATMALLATFPPNDRLPVSVVRRISFATMDDALLDAFAFPHPSRTFRGLVRGALRARGRVVRFLPPRAEPFFARQLPQVRSYPGGYRVDQLGTFPARCPVPHPRDPEPAGASARN
jgi:hypothetical protein